MKYSPPDGHQAWKFPSHSSSGGTWTQRTSASRGWAERFSMAIPHSWYRKRSTKHLDSGQWPSVLRSLEWSHIPQNHTGSVGAWATNTWFTICLSYEDVVSGADVSHISCRTFPTNASGPHPINSSLHSSGNIAHSVLPNTQGMDNPLTSRSLAGQPLLMPGSTGGTLLNREGYARPP